MADQLETYAWTPLGNLRHAQIMYSDYKMKIKLPRDKTKMWENINYKTKTNEK